MSNQLGTIWIPVLSRGRDQSYPEIPIDWLRVLNTQPLGLPIGILHAIKQKFSKDAIFSAKFPGGIWFGQAPQGTPSPYIIIQEVTSVPYWMTGPGYYEVESISVKIWSLDGDGLKFLGNEAERWLDKYSVQRIDGFTSTLYRLRSVQYEDPDRTENNEIIYYYNIDYNCFISKTTG